MRRKKSNELKTEDINTPKHDTAAEDTECYEPDMIFDNEIEQALFEYCDKYNIEDISKETQSRWNGALRYIYTRVFKGNKQALKSHNNISVDGNNIPSNYNAYNYELVNSIADYYIYLCLIYSKEISIIGFSLLTGIDYQLMYMWGDNNNKLSSLSFAIYEKLITMREESLSSKLADGSIKNPVGVIAILNRRYGWASPYTSDSNKQVKPLTSEQLPQLGNNTTVPQIEQPKE